METNADLVSDTFMSVAEAWLPKDGKLVHAEGDYAHSPAFAKASVVESFTKGEGLPGKVWESEEPIILKNSTDRTSSGLKARQRLAWPALW